MSKDNKDMKQEIAFVEQQVLTIRHWPDPILQEKTQAVTVFDDTLRRTVQDMWATLAHMQAVGLAANQVGIPFQIFVMDCRARQASALPRVLINPQWLGKNGAVVWKEGCLSFPELSLEIDRFADVKMSAQDEFGEEKIYHFQGLEAVCAQHEWDHLQGISFTDHLGMIERDIALEEYFSKIDQAKKNQ
jgi:peptide deformylase